MFRRAWKLFPLMIVVCACGSDAATAPPIPPPDKPTVALQLSAASIYVGLDSAVLSWTVTNASSCAASGDWTGGQPMTGSHVVRSDSARVLSFVLGCTGPGGTSSQTVQLNAQLLTHSTCLNEHAEFFWVNPTRYAVPVRMGEYLPVNSIGPLDADPTIVACMTSKMRIPGIITASWTWGLRAAGYPTIGYGSFWYWEPGQSTTTTLPSIVTALPDSLIVNFDVTINATGQVNTLVDMNVTPALKPDVCRNTEVMIITYHQGMSEGYQRWVNNADTATLGGVQYRIPPWGFLRPNPFCAKDPTSWAQFIQLHTAQPMMNGSIKLKPVFDYLVRRGAFLGTDYLQLIYFGTEMYGDGQGTTKLNSYSIRSR